MTKVYHRSKSDNWCSPTPIISRVIRMGPLACDPCTTEHNHLNAQVFYTEKDDGLTKDWKSLTYCNPPYSKMKLWAPKIKQQAEKDVEIIALVKNATGTRWFESLWGADAICFVSGRLRFVGAENSAPFESLVLYFGRRKATFRDIFGEIGRVL